MAKFVKFDRPGRATERDEYLEEGETQTERTDKQVAVNPACVSMVLSTDNLHVCIIRGADGREGVKVMGSYDEVVTLLSDG